jgi:hypothetical protein
VPPKSHTHKKCGTLRKKSFSARGMLKFIYKGHFLTIKKTYKKLLKISIFGGISKFLKLIVLGQILAVLGRFG